MNEVSSNREMSTPHVRGASAPLTEDLLDLTQWSGNTATQELVSRKLEECFNNNMLCSTCGPVLIILNPFCSPLDQTGAHTSGAHMGIPGLEANLKKLATQAHENLAASGLGQAVFFTGEAAAGKTFSSQRFLREILLISGGRTTGSGTDLFKNVLASITVLRALCSAKTVISPDSSRMMRLFELYYRGRSLQGARIRCYFLDQSRVTCPPPREQNYNIFYQMLAGLRPEDRGRLRLEGYAYKHFHILSECQSPLESQETLVRKYEAWKTCLGALRVPHLDVLRILSSVLLLGNVEFVMSSNGSLKVYGEKELVSSAVLLGLSSKQLREVLVGSSRGISKMSRAPPVSTSSAQINSILRGLSRALYTRLLGAVLRRINEQLLRFPSSNNHSPTQEEELCITVADMFGFDSSNNGMEQFCTNWTAELMQQSYHECVFKVTTDFLQDDGIETDMNYDLCSGSRCLSLLSNSVNGVISLISECTVLSPPSKHSSVLIKRMRTIHRVDERFVDLGEGSELFGIIHFSGQVVYDCKKLILANLDTIPGDLVQLFSKDSCSFPFVTSLFNVELNQAQNGSLQTCRITPPLIESNQSANKNYKTFLSDFHTRLSYFFDHIKELQPHFVRCIRTNDHLQPDTFNRLAVRRQIQSMSIVETIELISEGLIYNFTFEEFRDRYGFLVRKNESEGDVEMCKSILKTLSSYYLSVSALSTGEQFAFGRTRLFLNAHSHAVLEKLRSEREKSAASAIQRAFRRYAERKRRTPMNRPRRSSSLSHDTSRGVNSDKAPRIPPQRRYTIVGGYKIGFPQVRRMRATYEGECKLVEGTQVYVLGVASTRGHLIVEHNGMNVHVPFQYTELQDPMARPTTYL